MRMKRDVYFGWLRLMGEEDRNTFLVAGNYALALIRLQHFKQAKTLLRKVMPVARRVLRESNDLTLKMRFNYARALYMDPAATLNDLREAVTTSEEIEGIARHVLGGAHLLTTLIEKSLQNARAALRARETQPSPLPSSESV
jgi:hypothetical protein